MITPYARRKECRQCSEKLERTEAKQTRGYGRADLADIRKKSKIRFRKQDIDFIHLRLSRLESTKF